MIMKKLTSYCSLNMGQSPDSKTYNTNGEGMPFYQGNADFGVIHPVTRVWCSQPVKKAKKGDILISVRAPIGAMNIANEDCCIGRGLAALTPFAETSTEFLYYAVQSRVDSLIAQGTGSTFKAISKKVLEETLLPSFSKKEQVDIIRKLGLVDSAIAERQKQLDLLKQLVKSRFIEMFGDPRINPKGYDIVSISSLFDVGSSKRVFESEWRESGVPFYRAREIVKLSKDGYVDNELFIEEEMYEAYKAKYGVPKAGDLMVTGVGTLGVCYIVKETDRFYFKDGNTLWFKNKGLCDVRFIKDQYDTDFVKEHITANANVSTVGTYTITNANNTLVLLPSLAEQEQYVEFCKQVDKSKFYIQQIDEIYLLIIKTLSWRVKHDYN